MQQLLIGIYDQIAEELVGPLQMFKAEAPAQRMFAEVMNMPQYARHAHDFQLVALGTLDTETLEVTPSGKRILLTGITLRATQLEQASQDNG